MEFKLRYVFVVLAIIVGTIGFFDAEIMSVLRFTMIMGSLLVLNAVVVYSIQEEANQIGIETLYPIIQEQLTQSR